MTSGARFVQEKVRHLAHIPPARCKAFFKTGPGDYAEHDRFLGVSVPVLRRLARDCGGLAPDDLHTLLQSPYNEERLLALIVLVHRYQKGDAVRQQDIFRFYMDHRGCVNNWNLVDASAHLILGAHLQTRHDERHILSGLACSAVMWERRIAVVATWALIRQGDLEWTFRLARMLLSDPDDLMHKAVGWMIREAGKQNEEVLRAFLNDHAPGMPRTMLRSAVERLPPDAKKLYMTMRAS